jgi:hypothetical protein
VGSKYICSSSAFETCIPWPSKKVIALSVNLHSGHLLLVFFVASLPFLLFAVFLAVKRPPLNAEDRLILIVSTLYLALWFMAGLVDEVRLYVPFMMALSTVAARVLGSWMDGVSNADGRSLGRIRDHSEVES